MKSILVVLAIFFGTALSSQIDLELVVDGLDAPVAIENAGDERLFIVEREGSILILHPNGDLTTFLNIEDNVNTSFSSERGLLGLAFHPDYENNGYFYINYTGSGGDTRVSRFSVSGDQDEADASSETILLIQDQPFANHNGGNLEFGPDGYLYIGFGDGGGFDDLDNNAQDTELLLGKMLRIDIDNGNPYAIPADNPFLGPDGVEDEIWAIGLRNPWRYSFDAITGDLWIADVGQEVWEEINVQPASSIGGENYGWRCYEGDASFNTSGCASADNYTFPIYDYSHSNNNCSVTGGFVYRGSEMPENYGKYFFCDYCTGIFWTLTDNGGDYEVEEVHPASGIGWSTFGEDENNELYVARIETGSVYKLITLCSNFEATFEIDGNELTASEGSQFQWFLNGVELPGATDQVYVATVSGAYSVQIINDQGCEDISDQVGVVVSSINDLAIIESLELYPNPLDDFIIANISLNQIEDVELLIYNTEGKIIWNKKIANVIQLNETISMTDISSGLYTLKVKIGDEFLWKILIKE